MTSIPALMRLLQFGDSMLPVGAFSFSNGLESAVQRGFVHDPDSLERFVRTATRQSATTDGIALLEAFRGAQENDPARIAQADHAVFNRKLNEEMRTMTVRMGRKLAEMAVKVLNASAVGDWLNAIKRGETPGTYPVGQALVFSALGLNERDAFAVHQYGLASMMLGASLRLMKLDYLDAQAILYRINGEAEAAYERATNRSLDDMASFSPLIDVLAAAHVRATIRLFMN
ncbi:urease accessory protein UreF [Singulisphaera acidiphila DSM 18658]|uniref:Urease accessory protein UreF n=2 Tax=Singulisphaera acidiphila TaxID=466153 RepID=L0D8L6_SINAD|nr:urease accessory protein UreF [Singulisphaera acidiphila]AGA25577.1 urease accessory protein UreF [Singulisphaera acidiphila DSM 18658]